MKKNVRAINGKRFYVNWKIVMACIIPMIFSLINWPMMQDQRLCAECIQGNCFNGYGTYTQNGIKYVGPFKNGQPYGEGSIYAPNGTVTKGFLKNGVMDCRSKKCTLTEKDHVYKGQMENGLPHGYGVDVTTGGPFANHKYVGFFKNGVKHGKGTYYWPNGRRFEGQWISNKIDGFGVYYSENNAVLQKGMWKGRTITSIGL